MALLYKNIKPLVIGLGIAGKRHLEAQLNLGITTGIFTTNLQTAKSLKDQDNVIIFDNLEEGLDWSNLVHVCTPDDKHTEFVALALKKGRAVLCEKAFTTNLKDALYLQDLAHQYKSTLIIGQNYRLTPTFLETRKRVMSGALGKITRIETTYLHDKNEYQKRKPLRKNEDFLYIGGSHAVDLACWIAEEQVASVKASLENELSYQIILEFSSGLLADIKLSADSSRSTSGTDLAVSGEEGKLVSHNKLDDLLFYKKGENIPHVSQLPNTNTYTIPLEVRLVDNYLSGKLTSFSPLPGVDEVIDTIKVLDAIQKSISSNQEVSL